MKINKEGRTIILISFCLTILLSGLFFIFAGPVVACIVTVLALLQSIFVVIFFREPVRPLLTDDKLVYAPADGRIVIVEAMDENEYFGEKKMQVSVFMSLTNVHINWFPVGGTVEYYKYHPGRYLVAWHPKSSELNEHTTVVVDNGRNKILFRQIAGLVARRIVSYAKVGDKVGQNSKCGFIKFGSRVDLLLPIDCEILVNLNDKVTGSQTPIARLK